METNVKIDNFDLLDEIAIFALQGLLASESYGTEECGGSYIKYSSDHAATRAYNLAEAMMEERSKRREQKEVL